MKNLIKCAAFVWIALVSWGLGCATVNTEVMDLSPDYEAVKPSTVVVLPIMNETVDLDAPEVFRPIVELEIRSRGYRIVNPARVDEILMENDVFDAGQVYAFTPTELGELLDVDALLYTTVTEWRTTYLVAYAVIEVGARFELIDAETEAMLWRWERSLADRRVGYDRDTLAETAILALMPYKPYVKELVRMAFATLPWY